MKKSIYALSTLSATIIGVGLFSLPYITSQVGPWLMLGYFLVLTSLVILIHRLFGEVALATPDYLRLPGYAQIYLGKWGKRTALFSAILGFFGALLAYLLIGGEFLTGLLAPYLGGNELLYTFLYFLVGASLIFFGIKAVAKIEFWGLILFFVILGAIFFRGLPFLKTENLLTTVSGLKDWFLPYGPILFSLWGAALIPEAEEILGRDKKLLRKIIPLAIIIPALIYLLFIYLVVGITGAGTSLEAVAGLKNQLGDGVIALILFFGILTTFTSFIALGLTLTKIFWYDIKIPRIFSWFLTCFVPLALFLLGFHNFLKIIGLVGGVMLAIDGILIILMYLIVKKIPRWSFLFFLISFLILIFVLGIIYELIYFLK